MIKDKTCPICHGDGVIPIREVIKSIYNITDYREVACPSCHGTGKKES